MNNSFFYQNKHEKNNKKAKSYQSLKYATTTFILKKRWLPTTIICCVVAVALICATIMATGFYKSSDIQGTIATVTTSQRINQKPQKQEKVYPVFRKTEKTKKIPKENLSKYAIVIDKNDNTIVAQREAHKRVHPASTTKIMTLLVAAENMNKAKGKFTMTYDITNPLHAADASVAGFSCGEKITIKDLMYGTILPSGADAAIGLAIKIAGSEKKFVKLMNKKIKDLGLKNTHFTNVTGLHHEKNYSSAYDMAIILDTAIKNDLCKEILSTYQHTTRKTAYHSNGILLTSTLFKYMYGTEPKTATISGGKTGYLDESGYCIAAYGQANKTKNSYIVVTLGGPSRQAAFNDQITLFRKFAK